MSDQVPEGWKQGKFGDLAKVQNGYAFKSSDFSDVGYAAAIRMSNLKLGRVDLSDAKYVHDSVVRGLEQFRLRVGDFLFGMSGSLDNYAWVKKQDGLCYLNQRVGCLRNKPNTDPLFTSYCYLSETVRREITGLAAGAAQLNISGNQLEAISVPLPPLPEQKKIAAILSSVDEVIEKTRAQIDKLKDLKTGMMQELLTKGIGSGGVPHTEFKDSPVGKIPVGWESYLLGDVFDLKNGVNKDKDAFGHGVPIISYKNVYVGGGILDSDLSALVEMNEKELSRFRVHFGDVFFTRTSETPDEIGFTNVYLGERDDVVFNGFVIRGRQKNNLFHPHFLKYIFQSNAVRKQMMDNSKFTTRAGISGESLGRIAISVPDISEQKNIANALDSVEARITKTINKINAIQSFKKALMQDLLTGKVRVQVDTCELADV
ncbi:restriction endonuclease subunit S [Vreelandella nigrificans]|uniref:Type I restriction modification DNA specificity domain-containing protein n=1 Tax=Vreelandella nigrificans TaxID=2042704 RepID=A0A2A4HQM1_9GAMM|nr:restriction endonuclease subunit S [Halomonas nigrificans]PCF96344.1 hypothetical protein CPA45_07360 [Halomonas nigrificans]